MWGGAGMCPLIFAKQGVPPLLLQRQGPWLCVDAQAPTFFFLQSVFAHPYWKFLDPPLDRAPSKKIMLTSLPTWNCTHRVILTSRTVFMNKNLGRIRALLWYLIIAYQSHNNKNDHLTWSREGPRLNAWVSRYHYPRTSNKHLLLWKISSADN